MNFLKNICKGLLLKIIFFSFTYSWSQNIDIYKWKHRLIIVKGTVETKKKISLQMKYFENSHEELKERRFCVIEVLDNVYRVTNYLREKSVSDWKKIATENRLFSKKTTFKVLLIGLDGSIKRTYKQLVSDEDIFKVVDKMPMRAREIKSKSHY